MNNFLINIILKNDIINLFFLKYKVKLVILKINYLEKNNLISFKKKKKILFLLKEILINKNHFLKNEKIFHKINFNLLNFFINLELEDVFLIKLYILDEIEKFHLLICYIRKILITLSEKNIDLICFIQKTDNFILLSDLYLLFDEIFKTNHLNLFILKKKIIKIYYHLDILMNLKFDNLLISYKKYEILNDDYLYFFFYIFSKILLDLEKICLTMLETIFLNRKDYIFNKKIKEFIKKIKILNKKYSNYNEIYINLNNIYNVKEVIINIIYNAKICLEYYIKLISNINININFKFNILNSIKKEKIFFYYLKKKNICNIECIIIIKKILKYMFYNNLSIYNISIKELKSFSSVFEKDIYYYFMIPSKFIKIEKKKNILKNIQKSKFILNNLIIKFKI